MGKHRLIPDLAAGGLEFYSDELLRQLGGAAAEGDEQDEPSRSARAYRADARGKLAGMERLFHRPAGQDADGARYAFTDSAGKVWRYHSLEEMPPDVRAVFEELSHRREG